MKWLLRIALVVVAIYVAFNLAYPTYSHRYRLTLEFEIDGQTRSGSSVYEVYSHQRPKVLPDIGGVIGYRGEAIAVDLGKYGEVFAILVFRH
jgi:hypothetical protein